MSHLHTGPITAGEPDVTAPPARSWPLAVGLVVGAIAVVAIAFLALGLPAVKSAPHHVPLGVTGPQQAITAVQGGLAVHDPDAVEITVYPDAAALRAAIESRDESGGLVVAQDGTTMLVASAGSPAVAQFLTTAATSMSQAGGPPVTVQDVAPLPASDPRGAGLAAAALPLTLAGLLPAVLTFLRLRTRPWVAAGTAAGAAVGIGLAVALLLHSPFGTLDGSVWTHLLPVAGAVALTAAAISLPVLGLGLLFKQPGLGLGAATMVLLGVPLSGLASAPELLPAGWGTLGQLLPPGAGGTLLRSAAFFGGAGSGPAVLVLCGWIVVGLALITVAQLRTTREAPVPVS